MAWREISPSNFNNLKESLVIDVRSPCEFEAGRIPGSINVPLLSDEERTRVGIIYKQQGELLARQYALGIISPKIPRLVESVISCRTHRQALVIYCWRGGLRSEAVASVLSIAGYDCFRLSGGYKAWRTGVLQDFAADEHLSRSIVLHGLTGVGKTELLQALEKRGFQVVDLEQLANHRGSVFGGLGLNDQPTQKNFDAVLWKRLKDLDPLRPVLLEAESRKIGKVALPDSVLKRINTGVGVLIEGSIQARVQRIAQDYLNSGCNTENELQRGVQLLDRLKERLGGKSVARIRELVCSGQMKEAIEILLINYYDPLYNKQIERAKPFAFHVSGDDPVEAVSQIETWIATSSERFDLSPTNNQRGVHAIPTI